MAGDSVPPRRAAPSYLITEGLVARGWDVTLFASRDSVTRARLHAVGDKGYEEDPAADPKSSRIPSYLRSVRAGG
jgi:hypothetical protein